MMRERYESICLADLKEMAKNRGIKIVSGMKKADIVDAMLAKDQEESREASKEAAKKEEAEIIRLAHLPD